ncbi:HNH endonuclease [Nocardioides yefusunii]|uniref:HNH endonuclease n=1 Tax=Nocardioides yefusunii TaxID=2500546 RepID=A0ABW1QYE0_9ACTN|nr:HNH endonuclease [Nocardioides yefusunii]
MNEWSGRRVTEAREWALGHLPATCGKCGGPIKPAQGWVLGHIKDRALFPELMWQPTNWQREHRDCSNSSSQSVVQKNAAVTALVAVGVDRADAAELVADGGLFPEPRAPRQSPPLPFSLPATTRPRVTATSKAAPSIETREPLILRQDLVWDSARLREYSWLEEFALVPDDAAPPLAMTPPHPEAVCSYGWDGCTHVDPGHQIVRWARESVKVDLRWWQRLAIVRQMEHRADGTPCWEEVDETAPRRSGKSVRIRVMALWRMAHADLIGEIQTVVHCGNDLPICREIQRGAWPWARARWGDKSVTTANGKEQIEGADGSRWLVKAQDSVYGYDAGLGVVDEAWDVKPAAITEGLEPALMERLWSQLHITSTAHRKATSLLKGKISAALASDDGRTLLLWWGALPQDDPGDPEVHRKASPHWSAEREKMLATKYERALLGEDDPDADDPDPMEGFRAQYLNVWALKAAKLARGTAIVDRAAWDELTVPAPSSTPTGCAVESWFDSGVSVALAWTLEDGAALVHVVDCPDLATAREAVDASGYRGRVSVGASIADHVELRGLPLDPVRATPIAGVLDIAQLLRDGQLAHAGGDALTRQILAQRTVPGAGGPRLATHARADAIKAAAWAASAARNRPARKSKMRVLVASS